MMFGFFIWLGRFFLAGTPAFHTLNVLYACGGALLMSFYIVYDTQLLSEGSINVRMNSRSMITHLLRYLCTLTLCSSSSTFFKSLGSDAEDTLIEHIRVHNF